MKKKNLVARIILAITILVVFAAGIVMTCGIYTNGFESVKSKYAMADDTVIKNGKSVFTLTNGKDDLVLDLKGAGFKAANWGNYTVDVKSNTKSGITFTVGGEAYKYENIDFTPVIRMNIAPNTLTIKAEKCDVKTVLKKTFGYNVKVDMSAFNADEGMYTVTITPEKGKGVSFGLNGILEPTGVDIPGSVTLG